MMWYSASSSLSSKENCKWKDSIDSGELTIMRLMWESGTLILCIVTLHACLASWVSVDARTERERRLLRTCAHKMDRHRNSWGPGRSEPKSGEIHCGSIPGPFNYASRPPAPSCSAFSAAGFLCCSLEAFPPWFHISNFLDESIEKKRFIV